MNDFGESDTNEAADDSMDCLYGFNQGGVPPVVIVDAYKGNSPDGGSGGHVTYGVKFKV